MYDNGKLDNKENQPNKKNNSNNKLIYLKEINTKNDKPIYKKINSYEDENMRKNEELPDYFHDKKLTFSDRNMMKLETPDSPTQTYEKRLFSRKSFDTRSNKEIFSVVRGNPALVKNDLESINNNNLEKKSIKESVKETIKRKRCWYICCTY